MGEEAEIVLMMISKEQIPYLIFLDALETGRIKNTLRDTFFFPLASSLAMRGGHLV